MPYSGKKNLKAHQRAVQDSLNRSSLLREVPFSFKFGLSCGPLQKLRLKVQRPFQENNQRLYLRLGELQKLLLPQIVQYAIFNWNSQHQLHR